MINLRKHLALVGGDTVPDSEKWRLLSDLYLMRAPVVGTIGILAAVGFGLSHTPSMALSIWGLSGVMVLGARFFLATRFRLRSSTDKPITWAWLFYAATFITGIQWSVGAVAMYHANAITTIAIIAVECALVTGASARGHTAPAATITQIGITCIAIASVFGVQRQWGVCAIYFLYLYFNVVAILELGRSALARVKAEVDRTKLIEMLAATNSELAYANEQLERTARTDSLTGLANRRGFDAYLREVWKSASETFSTVSLLMLDVDHFKRFNDEHGHPAGDACLAVIAGAVSEAVRRPEDFPARYGGEEFALILPGTDSHGALAVAERARQAVLLADVFVDGERISITVSIGVSTAFPARDISTSNLIDSADRALYQAKLEGRNCVRIVS